MSSTSHTFFYFTSSRLRGINLHSVQQISTPSMNYSLLQHQHVVHLLHQLFAPSSNLNSLVDSVTHTCKILLPISTHSFISKLLSTYLPYVFLFSLCTQACLSSALTSCDALLFHSMTTFSEPGSTQSPSHVCLRFYHSLQTMARHVFPCEVLPSAVHCCRFNFYFLPLPALRVYVLLLFLFPSFAYEVLKMVTTFQSAGSLLA